MIPRSKLIATVLSGSAYDPVVTAYAARSGMETGKKDQLNSIVTYLKSAGLWDYVSHFYIAVKGFNAGSGVTLYDVVAGGSDGTIIDCTWGTEEGQGIAKPTAGSINVGKIIPAGVKSVVVGLRNPQGTNVFEAEDETNVYNLWNSATKYNHNPGQPSGAYLLDDATELWSTTYQDLGRGKDNIVAVCYDGANVYAWMDGANSKALANTAFSPAYPDADLIIGDNANGSFELMWFMVLNGIAISGAQYQDLYYYMNLYLAPRDRAKHHPGLPTLTTSNEWIRAYSGGLLDDTARSGYYYMFGQYGKEQNGYGDLRNAVGLTCYRSTDLLSWVYVGIAVAVNEPNLTADVNEGLSVPNLKIEDDQWLTERPKVLYNSTNEEYVMMFHISNASTQANTGNVQWTSRHSLAQVAVYTANSPEGPWTFKDSYRPCGIELRDMTLFQDGDGTAYLCWATNDGVNNNKDLVIAKLDADYYYPFDNTGTGYTIIMDDQFWEAPVILKNGTRYWLIASPATSWTPGAGKSAYRDTDLDGGAWTSVGNPYSADYDEFAYSFHSQSTHALLVDGSWILWSNRHNPNMYYLDAGADQDAHDLRNMFWQVSFEVNNSRVWVSGEQHWI